MTEITLNLKDDIVKKYGEIFLKKFLEKQMEYLGLSHLMDRIEEQIQDSRMDYDKELEQVRESAWQEYKKDFFH
ncbi:MAG: hypothetical protein ACM3SY_17205 [Candidatus Omnitrophota bacterium]